MSRVTGLCWQMIYLLTFKQTNKKHFHTEKEVVINQTTSFFIANGNHRNTCSRLEVNNSQIFKRNPTALISWCQWHTLVFETSKAAQQSEPRREPEAGGKDHSLSWAASSTAGYLQNSCVNRARKQVLILRVEATARGNSMSLAARSKAWRPQKELCQLPGSLHLWLSVV